MTNLSGRFPDKMNLERGYYVVNASTMSLIAGPFVDTSAAYTAWQAARDRTLGTTFIIVWVPHTDFAWGDRKAKTVAEKAVEKEARRRGKSVHVTRYPAYVGSGQPVSHAVITDAPAQAPRTVAQMFDDLHAEFGSEPFIHP